ncbi:MAG TPA: 5'-3' exonuclease H3TH domain-containing protein [Acidimicrobiales bacterium]|nr:5'-3' exonuclease H3TH domain-containing protein [Acidimicrobiales bacterium]
MAGLQIYLIDGTYELFRHHFGQPALRKGGTGGEVSRRAATRGVLNTVAGLLADGATHVGVATDHVIESFRNDLWPAYKSSAGMPEELTCQFPLLEEALESMGVKVWPMVDLEADDALASAAEVAAEDPSVERVLICTPDKDLGQCVRDARVVQLDRRTGAVLDEEGVRAKFGVGPASVPDWLALVGDSSDGYPGLSGWGPRSAAEVLAVYGEIEKIPDTPATWDPGVFHRLRGTVRLAGSLAAARDQALLFKRLATLVVDRSLLGSVDELRWAGPRPDFAATCERLGAASLAERVAGLGDRA